MTKGNNLNQFGSRLRSARKMAGLSMEDLANKAGGVVSKQAISKYENGKMNPSSDVLIRLSAALQVKPEYFFRTSNINLTNVEFRKKSKLLVKTQESIKLQSIDFLERYIQLENILGKEEKFTWPFDKAKIKTIEDIETVSLKLRDFWQLGLSPINNFLELLEEHGIKVFEVRNVADFDGLAAEIEGIHILVINKDMPADRIRFTAAHELAHLLCEFENKPEIEKLCHAFAGAFLLPKSVLIREIMPKRENISIWELKELKELYGLSVQAIIKRAHILGIISDFYYRNFNIMLNRKGWRNLEPFAYSGKEEPIRFRQLLHYAVNEAIISMSRGAELANQSLSDFQDEVRAVV